MRFSLRTQRTTPWLQTTASRQHINAHIESCFISLQANFSQQVLRGLQNNIWLKQILTHVLSLSTDIRLISVTNPQSLDQRRCCYGDFLRIMHKYAHARKYKYTCIDARVNIRNCQNMHYYIYRNTHGRTHTHKHTNYVVFIPCSATLSCIVLWIVLHEIQTTTT